MFYRVHSLYIQLKYFTSYKYVKTHHKQKPWTTHSLHIPQNVIVYAHHKQRGQNTNIDKKDQYSRLPKYTPYINLNQNEIHAFQILLLNRHVRYGLESICPAPEFLWMCPSRIRRIVVRMAGGSSYLPPVQDHPISLYIILLEAHLPRMPWTWELLYKHVTAIFASVFLCPEERTFLYVNSLWASPTEANSGQLQYIVFYLYIFSYGGNGELWTPTWWVLAFSYLTVI